MIKSREEYNRICEKVINGTANESEQKDYEDFIKALDHLVHDWYVLHSPDEKAPIDKMMNSLFSTNRSQKQLGQFKDDPNVDQNFLKYRVAMEKEKHTWRYKIRCFFAKFHR